MLKNIPQKPHDHPSFRHQSFFQTQTFVERGTEGKTTDKCAVLATLQKKKSKSNDLRDSAFSVIACYRYIMITLVREQFRLRAFMELMLAPIFI